MDCLVTRMQRLLPGCQQCPVAITGLCPQAKHFQGQGCARIVQETLLPAMTRATGKTVASDQQLACLVAQPMGETKVGAIGGQEVAGGLHDLADRK